MAVATLFHLHDALSVLSIFRHLQDALSARTYVALSIDGTKRSGNMICDLPIPDGLFEHEIMIDLGHSMLKRFQMNGKTLEGEKVSDRLLLTY
jgi:DNA adenine methylase